MIVRRNSWSLTFATDPCPLLYWLRKVKLLCFCFWIFYCFTCNFLNKHFQSIFSNAKIHEYCLDFFSTMSITWSRRFVLTMRQHQPLSVLILLSAFSKVGYVSEYSFAYLILCLNKELLGSYILENTDFELFDRNWFD